MNTPRTHATTKTTTTACQMCDIALEYDALSAEFLASRKVQCGRCTFVNDIVEKEEKTKTKTASSSSSEGVKGDEAFARRLQKEEDARGSNHGRSFASWMKDLFSALPLPQEEAKKRPPTCAKCERTVTDVGVFDGERVTQNNMFSRTTTVRYYQTSEY